MRPCSAALKAFLEGSAREAIQIDLYTFSLLSGEVFRWSGGNAALTVPSAGFPSLSINAGADRTFTIGPGFGRSQITAKIGIEPAELSVSVYSDAVVSGNNAFTDLARLGLLDGATVELDRFFAPPPSGITIDTSLGCLIWFKGQIGEIEIGRSIVTLKVKSVLNKLATTQFPPRLYASSCTHVFGGTMCGYDRVAGENALGVATGVGEQTITAISGTTQSAIYASYIPSISPSPYIEGTVTCVTGANVGANRTISDHESGVVTVKRPWLSPVSIGDTFHILPGCAHTTDICDTVFNNLARYGGFPKIPPPESSV